MAVLAYTCRAFVYFGAWCALCYGQESTAVSSCDAEASKSTFSVETADVSNGAQLVTVLEAQPNEPNHFVPVVSVLRDTLGDADPSNDRLENVWVYNRNPTAWWQNVAAGIPFFYGHVSGRQKVDRQPKSVLNLSAPTDRTLPRMVAIFAQSMVLDGNGLPLRLPTRTYRSNVKERNAVSFHEVAAKLEQLEKEGGCGTDLSLDDVRAMRARLMLRDNLFGGFVAESSLNEYTTRQYVEREATRAHNWEVLRQAAESSGLYFEPLGKPGEEAFALVWIAREEALRGDDAFDGQFLGFSNPWRGNWVARWKGYSELWYLDEENRRVEPGSGAAIRREMIPLGLYNLRHPRTPLLVADFRSSGRTKRHEVVRRATSDVVVGVLGFTTPWNLPYLAATTTWNFVTRRHGAAVDRTARLISYAEARRFAATSNELAPALSAELKQRLDGLVLNPLDTSDPKYADLAIPRYEALKANVDRLSREVAKQRNAEAARLQHGSAVRALLAITGRFGGGSDAAMSDDVMERLDHERRRTYNKRVLEEILNASHAATILDASKADYALKRLASDNPDDPDVSRYAERLFALAGDEPIRMDCLQALQNSSAPRAKEALIRISRDSGTAAQWRALAALYLEQKRAALPVVSGS